MDAEAQLSRRERQIMDIVYARGRATAGDVLEDLPDRPTRTTVRTLSTDSLRLNPLISIASNGMPSFGTMRLSRPLAEPM